MTAVGVLLQWPAQRMLPRVALRSQGGGHGGEEQAGKFSVSGGTGHDGGRHGGDDPLQLGC